MLVDAEDRYPLAQVIRPLSTALAKIRDDFFLGPNYKTCPPYPEPNPQPSRPNPATDHGPHTTNNSPN